MNDKSNPIQKLVINFGIYAVLMLITIVTFTMFKLPWLLALMWIVGLGGITVLGLQAGRLLSQTDRKQLKAQAQLEAHREQALAYKSQIDHVIKTASKHHDPVHRQQLQVQVDAWTKSILDLIKRIESLHQNPLITRDLQGVPKAIKELESRLSTESDSIVRSQLERTITNRQEQLAALQELQNIIRRAEFQVESTTSRLGTIYSQLLTSQSTSATADYSRISADVDEEVDRLQDHLEALREVKLSEL